MTVGLMRTTVARTGASLPSICSSATWPSRSSLALPVSAVRNDRPRPYVQIVRDNKVVHQNVDLGAQGQFDGQWMVAVDGLAAGTTVSAGSVGRLREGTAVKLAGSPL